MSFVNALILLWLLACAISDWRSRRVPNAWTYGFALVAVLPLLLAGQTLLGQPWHQGLLGAAAAALLTLPGFALNRLGGGDVKLLLGLGLAVGPLPVATTFVISTLVLLLFLLAARWWPGGAGEAGWRQEQPFVPSLLVGYLVSCWCWPG